MLKSTGIRNWPQLAILLGISLLLLLTPPRVYAEDKAVPPPRLQLETPTSITEMSTPGEWARKLRSQSESFSAARLSHREALLQLNEGKGQNARSILGDAIDEDPSYAASYWSRAKLDFRRGKPAAFSDLVESARLMAIDFRGQSLALANVYLIGNLMLALFFLWICGSLFLRYGSFARHQLASFFDRDNHLKRRARLFWVPILAPIALGLGVIPALLFAFPINFIYGDKRVRLMLGSLICFFIVQGYWSAPFSVALSGADPQNVSVLSSRAARDPLGPSLEWEIDNEIFQQPDNAEAHAAKGVFLGRQGKFRASTESFLRSLTLRPDDPRTIANLATNHFYTGDINKAVAGYQKSASLDSTRAITHYNLSQAYLKKLYFREGGDAMQAAIRHGFRSNSFELSLGNGAVHYAGNTNLELWAAAWDARDGISIYDFLAPWQRWIGVPSHQLHHWLAAIFLFSMLFSIVKSRGKLVFECVNCGDSACGRCRGDHQGAIMCAACARTARRAKSDMVLQTLLRNRRREAERVYQNRLRKLDWLLLGAGRLYNGLQLRGSFSAAMLSLFSTGLILGGIPLHDPWHMVEGDFWNITRIACAGGLLLMELVILLSRSSLRTRHLHPHPSSLVSLVGLIEGKEQKRIKAEASSWQI